MGEYIGLKETFMSSWHSYSSSFAISHKSLQNIFSSSVVIEEKIDGSQFNFGIIEGELKIKSKGVQIVIDHPEKLFSKAVEEVVKRKYLLTPGWTYRAEYLRIPKHNILTYNRTPTDHIMIFDIAINHEDYLPTNLKAQEAKRLGFEIVPLLFEGIVTEPLSLNEYLKLESVLGGPKIEGIVIKNYSLMNFDKKIMLGKLVSDEFKEKHQKDAKNTHPSSLDIVDLIGKTYRTEARWLKVIQHLRDEGKLVNAPNDIGLLLSEIKEDILKDSKEEIMEQLFNYAWPKIARIITGGFPEFYKSHLNK